MSAQIYAHAFSLWTATKFTNTGTHGKLKCYIHVGADADNDADNAVAAAAAAVVAAAAFAAAAAVVVAVAFCAPTNETPQRDGVVYAVVGGATS